METLSPVLILIFDGTGERRRNFHRGFITFYGDQGLLSGDGVAHFNHDLSDFDFIAADIRDVNFFRCRGSRWSSGGRSGFLLPAQVQRRLHLRRNRKS